MTELHHHSHHQQQSSDRIGWALSVTLGFINSVVVKTGKVLETENLHNSEYLVAQEKLPEHAGINQSHRT